MVGACRQGEGSSGVSVIQNQFYIPFSISGARLSNVGAECHISLNKRCLKCNSFCVVLTGTIRPGSNIYLLVLSRNNHIAGWNRRSNCDRAGRTCIAAPCFHGKISSVNGKITGSGRNCGISHQYIDVIFIEYTVQGF